LGLSFAFWLGRSERRSLRWGFRMRFGWGGANVGVIIVDVLVGANVVLVGAFVCVLVGEERT
jgi:hypothetical protein